MVGFRTCAPPQAPAWYAQNPMSYTVGYSPRRVGGKVSEITLHSAGEAHKTVLDLQASDEMILYIKVDGVYEIGTRELKMHAEQEK